jgi:hypothetical protein
MSDKTLQIETYEGDRAFKKLRDMGGGIHAEAVTGALVTSSASAVACPATGNTALLTISTAGLERLFVQISVATQALDAFLIQGRAASGASFVTLFSAAGDFTSPAGLMVDASGDLTTLAASGTGWFVMDVRGLYEVKLLASGAVDSAAVTVYAGAQ